MVDHAMLRGHRTSRLSRIAFGDVDDAAKSEQMEAYYKHECNWK
jgi:hypothetical protein